MRVLYAGTPATAVAPLEALLQEGLDVVGVLTRLDAPVGRKKVLTPSPVAQRAAELSLPVIKANRWDEVAREAVVGLAPDVAAVVAYGAILPQEALDLLPHGWINLHFSTLPAWRGAAPVQRALMAGETELGASTFRIEAGLDTGPVYRTLTETVGPEDTAGSLLERMGESGGRMLAQTLREIQDGTARPAPQQGTPTKAAKLTHEDARIDWTASARGVEALVRGTTPEPGAWTMLEGQRIKMAGLHPVADDDPQEAGEQSGQDPVPGTARLRNKRVQVRAGDGWLDLARIQPAGKTMMDAASWARGAGHLDQGTVIFR